MAPFDGMAPYGPIYDTHAALFLEPSNPEMGLVELQSFDGGRLT